MFEKVVLSEAVLFMQLVKPESCLVNAVKLFDLLKIFGLNFTDFGVSIAERPDFTLYLCSAGFCFWPRGPYFIVLCSCLSLPVGGLGRVDFFQLIE